jgi:hypothetical protein
MAAQAATPFSAAHQTVTKNLWTSAPGAFTHVFSVSFFAGGYVDRNYAFVPRDEKLLAPSRLFYGQFYRLIRPFATLL